MSFRPDRLYFLVHPDLPAHAFHLPGHFFPELAGAEFRVEEFFDHTGLSAFLADIAFVSSFLRSDQFDGMCNSLGDRNALDTLGAPFGGYLSTGYPPDFLRIVLEEQAV